jgi:hypothetical protein
MPHRRTPHDRSDTFSNYRDWRAFLTAIQAPVTYASVATALKAGHEWLNGHASSVADRGNRNLQLVAGRARLSVP